MAAVGDWIAEQRRVYFDNAPMTREYRTQLRGSKAPWLIAGYLFMVLGMATMVYWGISSTELRSAARLQADLNGFFLAIVGMLEFLVGMTAPILAASSVVGEYQTKMIDLVFSSPMSAKYFLVGKLVAAYRYVLLLILVSLPAAAVSVVLGGATWGDVAASYFLVSMHGLIYMAISMPIAVLTGRAIPTVLWSYFAVGAYLVVTGFLSFAPMGPFGRTVSPFSGLSPFASGTFGGAMAEVLGRPVPIWIVTALIALVVVRILMLGAATALTGAGSKESVSLRIHGLLVAAAVFAVNGSSTGTVAFGSGAYDLPNTLLAVSWPLVIVLPYLSTWSLSGGRKLWPNGWWSLKWMMRGTPASGLPYLAAILLVSTVAYCVGKWTVGGLVVDENTLGATLGVFAMWGLAWSLGWLASSCVTRLGPEMARRLHLLFLFSVFALPPIGLWAIESALNLASSGGSTGFAAQWNPYFLCEDPHVSVWKPVALTVLAIGFGFLGERMRKNVVKPYQRLA